MRYHSRTTKASEPNCRTKYHYWELPERGWFRLLVIEPSSNPQLRISCSFIHQPIRGNHDFEALSYTWGDNKATVPILIVELLG